MSIFCGDIDEQWENAETVLVQYRGKQLRQIKLIAASRCHLGVN